MKEGHGILPRIRIQMYNHRALGLRHQKTCPHRTDNHLLPKTTTDHHHRRTMGDSGTALLLRHLHELWNAVWSSIWMIIAKTIMMRGVLLIKTIRDSIRGRRVRMRKVLELLVPSVFLLILMSPLLVLFCSCYFCLLFFWSSIFLVLDYEFCSLCCGFCVNEDRIGKFEFENS